MDEVMKMPDLATISASVKVLRWLVEPGADVRRGDPLLEVETDKATLVIESALTGTLRSILAEPGTDVPDGEAIALFDVEDEAAPHPTAAPPSQAREPGPAPTMAPPARGAGSFFARNRRAAGGGSKVGPQDE